MKIKMTKNNVGFGDKVLSIPYCDAQYLLYYREPIGYNAGVYGWNWDYYRVYTYNYNVEITTGYRSTVGRGIDRQLLKKYEDKARKIVDNNHYHNIKDYKKEYEAKRRDVEKLLMELLEVC